MRIGIIIIVAALVVGCSKNSVRKRQLEGKSYSVIDVAVYLNTDYSVWMSTNEGEDIMDGGQNVLSSSGGFDFTNPSESTVTINFSYETEGLWGTQYVVNGGFNYYGVLDHPASSSSIFLDHNGLNGEDFNIHEAKGDEILIIFESESIIVNPDANLYIARVKKD